MPPSTLARLPSLFPRAHLVNIYALTEGGSAAAFCEFPPGAAVERCDSVGKPVPPTEMRIVTEAGRDAAAGEVGEIWLRPKGPPRRYYRDAEATARTFVEGGWVKTGDLGHLDADGYLYLDDRKKNMVIRGGFNIFPAEIDALLEAHEKVREAAVVGVPHPVLGEDLHAFVALREPATVEELRAHLAAHLADYKVPRAFTFVEALPRNAMGKVVKRELSKRSG
jgi:fatty-acyl-CoA synthase/long-chain acyl-CoA synthetase